MATFTIDPEFKSKIPPLTDAEYEQLKENILEAGEVYEPIVVWNGIIVDGHNRWKIVQEHPEITYKVREMNFADKWAAFDWMYKNQLGRRNLTEEQKTYLIGKRYEAQKHMLGGDRRSRDFSAYQNGTLKTTREIKDGTKGRIGKEYGISTNAVVRAEQFAHGIDTIRTVSSETADDILNGKIKTIKMDVAAVAKAAPEDVPKMVEQIKAGQRVTKANVPVKPITKPSGKYTGGGTKEYREQRNKIAETATRMYDTDVKPEYKLSNLSDEIRWSAESFTKLILNILAAHQELVAENKEAIKGILDDQIINKMEEIKEDIDK